MPTRCLSRTLAVVSGLTLAVGAALLAAACDSGAPPDAKSANAGDAGAKPVEVATSSTGAAADSAGTPTAPDATSTSGQPAPTSTTGEPPANSTSGDATATTDAGGADSAGEATGGAATGGDTGGATEPDKGTKTSTKTGSTKTGSGGESGSSIAGKPLFAKHCKSCHGEDGQGKTKFAEKNEIPSLAKTSLAKAKIAEIVRDGIAGSKMKGYADKMSKEEIDAVAAYVKKL